MVRSRKRKVNKEKDFLAINFVPDETHVIIGKGMKYYHHDGNINMRSIITSMIHEYANAKSKKERSNVLTSILDQIRINGNFVKKDDKTGLWFIVDDVLARDKIYQTIRKMLRNNKTSKSKPTGKKRLYSKKSETYWGISPLRRKEEISTNTLQDFDFASDNSPSAHSYNNWKIPSNENLTISSSGTFSINTSLDQIEIFEPMNKICDSSKDCIAKSNSLESASIEVENIDLRNIPDMVYIPTNTSFESNSLID